MSQKPQRPLNPPTPTPVITHGWWGAFCIRRAQWIGAAVPLMIFGLLMLPHRDDPSDWHFRAFGRLPVIDQGRYKPMDTSARISLMLLTHRQQFANSEDKKTYPATKWYLDAATIAEIFHGNGPAPAEDYKIFRVENDQVLRMLNLKMREGLRYSYSEIMAGKNELILQREFVRLNGDEEGTAGIDPKDWSLLDGKIMELWQHLQIFKKIGGQQAPLVIPNADGSDEWKSLGNYYINDYIAKNGDIGDGIDARTFNAYVFLLKLYGNPDPDSLEARKREFNRVLTDHLAYLDKHYPARMHAIDAEIFFNEFAPFFWCWWAYVAIAVFAALSWIAAGSDWWSPMRKAAFSAMVVVFAVHVGGLLMRMYLQDRYFVWVTNLYSSAVFIGCGCVAMCLIVEAIFKNGIGIVAGSSLGFVTLVIAHLLSLDGDTMVMMQAVLDTNFWLATHVTCVTLGYTTVFVAGAIGIVYILVGVFTGALRGELSKSLASIIYGVLCTGMFLSFVGTVLGGLWADYSWGRFWGWDPKENGALLIVIWVALILHARWGGMVKQRGIAVLSVLGIIVTSWSWFGTNFLGVGLHSYGFRDGAMITMVAIDFGFLGIAGLGLLPLEHWQSFRPAPKVETPPLPPVPPTGIKPKPMGA